MSTRYFLLFILNFLSLANSEKNHVVVSWIESPRITTWGTRGEKQLCPPGSWVSGMNLKIESSINVRDDTGLNAIKLSCTTLNGDKVADITSKQGPWGSYRGDVKCENGFATGFQLRSEPSQGTGDDTAAVDLKLRCTGLDGTISHAVGEELLTWGKFTKEQKCLPETAVCGIVTYVEDSQGWGDDTSVNNVDMACCKLPIFNSE